MRYTVLSRRTIAVWAVLIVAAGVGMAVWLLLAYGADSDASVQLDAIRTAGTLVVGAGGAAALLLAARRQRSTEIALKHQERVALNTEADATERRITELYTKAADQLGSPQGPVRLAGLYALERVAQNNPDQRQTIVNLLCAYLRMPFTPPGEPPDDGADKQLVAAHRERVQEREVRLTAQRILTDHLLPDEPKSAAATFWMDIRLDLTGAVLIDFSLANCTLRTATFDAVTFTGVTDLSSATFTDFAYFKSATFVGPVSVVSTTFTDRAYFGSAVFTGPADFGSTTFIGPADFGLTTFADHAHFHSNTFTNRASFAEASFARGVPKEVERFWSPPSDAPGDGDAASG